LERRRKGRESIAVEELSIVTGWGLRVLDYVKTSASEPERKGVL
jgi:hypothetical protein